MLTKCLTFALLQLVFLKINLQACEAKIQQAHEKGPSEDLAQAACEGAEECDAGLNMLQHKTLNQKSPRGMTEPWDVEENNHTNENAKEGAKSDQNSTLLEKLGENQVTNDRKCESKTRHRCGPQGNEGVCGVNRCCSAHGWCHTGLTADCKDEFSNNHDQVCTKAPQATPAPQAMQLTVESVAMSRMWTHFGKTRNQGSNCIDGNLDMDWARNSCCATHQDENSWFKLDLGIVKKISYLKVTGRSDYDDGQSRDIDIRLGTSDNVASSFLCASKQDFYRQAEKKVNCDGGDHSAQYIWLQHKGWMVLCEIEVWGPIPAPQQLTVESVTMSRMWTHFGITRNQGSNCIDGNLDMDWAHNSCCATHQDENSWFKLDLGVVNKISYLKVTGRSDYDDGQSRDIDIRLGISDNVASSILCASKQDFYGQTEKQVNCDGGNHSAQYIWLQHNGWMVLCEIEVWGH